MGAGSACAAVAEVPTGEVLVRGGGNRTDQQEFLFMPNHAESLPRPWERLDLERFTRESPFPVQPVVVLQDPDANPAALVRHWPAPEDRVAKHRSYALQWYAMAVALAAFTFMPAPSARSVHD